MLVIFSTISAQNLICIEDLITLGFNAIFLTESDNLLINFISKSLGNCIKSLFSIAEHINDIDC